MIAVQENVCMIMCEVSYAQMNIMIACGKQLPEKHLVSETMRLILSFGDLHTC